MKKYIILMLLACSLSALAGKYKPIYNAEFEVDGKLSLSQVKKAIKAGVIKRGWSVVKTEKGVMYAKILVRSHMAKVKISFTSKTVRIDYEDSSNLGYREKHGEPLIHGNYNRWVLNLEQSINMALMAAID